MTINRYKKRYYSLSFFIAILISSLIIFNEQLFNTFTKIPYNTNERLKLQNNNLKNSYFLINNHIKNIKKNNKIYFLYVIHKQDIYNELGKFLDIFSKKINLFNISIDDIILSKKYYNIATIKIKGKSTNDYINQKFVNEVIVELIKELYPKNSFDIKINKNIVSFKYLKNKSNKELKGKKYVR